jgi:hypothetical protein
MSFDVIIPTTIVVLYTYKVVFLPFSCIYSFFATYLFTYYPTKKSCLPNIYD